jgi:DNA-binding transcriptional LysR family regulator
LRVSLGERNSADIVRSLHEGSADLGVLWDAVDLQGLRLEPYHSDHLCVAMAPSHRLARRPRLRFEETLEEVSVGVAPGGLMDRLLQRQAALLGRLVTHRIQVSSIDAACRIVAAGLGLAVLPREVAIPHSGTGRLALVPLDEAWSERRFVIASRLDPLRAAAAGLLAAHLRSAADAETELRRP